MPASSRSLSLLCLGVFLLAGGAWGQPGGAGPGDTLVLSRATVIDGRGGAPLADYTVVVRDGRISEVGPTARVSIPPGARVVDLHGQFLLPGLVDAHVHLGAERASVDTYLRFLFSGGITAVRDMAGDSFLYAQLRPGSNDAATPLPRLYYSANWAGPSFWDDRRWVGSTQGKLPGEASWARAITATSDLMAEAAAARALGVTGIKVYSDLPPEIVARGRG